MRDRRRGASIVEPLIIIAIILIISTIVVPLCPWDTWVHGPVVEWGQVVDIEHHPAYSTTVINKVPTTTHYPEKWIFSIDVQYEDGHQAVIQVQATKAEYNRYHKTGAIPRR